MTILKGKLINEENKPVPQASISVLNMHLSAVSGDRGEYLIQFTGFDADEIVTLDFKNTKHKPLKQSVPLKIGAITQADTVMLTKRT